MRDGFQADVLAIADDIIISGPGAACYDAVLWIQEQGATIGYHLNPAKSVVWAPHRAYAANLGRFRELGMSVQEQSIVALGSPIGSAEFQTDQLDQ